MKRKAILIGLGALAGIASAYGADTGVTILPLPATYVGPPPSFVSFYSSIPQIKQSRDGSTVFINTSINPLPYSADSMGLRYRINTGLREQIGVYPGHTYIAGLNANGNQVVLSTDETPPVGPPGNYPKTWTANGGFVDLISPQNFQVGPMAGASIDLKTVLLGQGLPNSGMNWVKNGTIDNDQTDFNNIGRCISGNGRYIFGYKDNSSVLFRFDIQNRTYLNIPTPAGGKWIPMGASDDGKTVTGYQQIDETLPNVGTYPVQHAFKWTQGEGVKMLPELFTKDNLPNSYGAGVSQDGSVIVGSSSFLAGYGYNTGGFHKATYWSKETGLIALEDAMASQGIALPQFLDLDRALDVTVVDGVVHVVGLCYRFDNYNEAPTFVQVRFTKPNRVGLPVDLNGTYLAARNVTSVVTTDFNDIYTPQVFPDQSQSFTPFNNSMKRPGKLDKVDLRGKGFQFDIDLDSPSRWPNLTSDQIYQNGNAAEGKDGASIAVRVLGSNGNLFPDRSKADGLRIAFYRRDGRFFAHLKNLWYNQDIDLPNNGGASRYRVKVDVAPDGQFDVTLTQLSGPNAEVGDELTHHFAGGSVEGQGIACASFMVEMVNKTSDPVAAPTLTRITNFSTTAVPNAMFLWFDRAHAKNTFGVSFRLGAANLTQPISGFSSSIKWEGPVGQWLGGKYESLDFFTTLLNPFTLDADQITYPAARTSGATSALDRSLATMWVFPGGYGKPLLVDEPEANYFRNGFNLFEPTLRQANRLVYDDMPPYVTTAMVQYGNLVDGSKLLSGPLNLDVTAVDGPAGLANQPRVSVDYGNDGTFEVWRQYLPNVDAATGLFRTQLTVPKTASARIILQTYDNAGNLNEIDRVFTVDSGVSMTIRLLGTEYLNPVKRAIRVAIGGPNGTFAAVTKCLVFQSPEPGKPAEAKLMIGKGAGYSLMTPTDLTWLFVKDPYHTLGKRITLTYANGVYNSPIVTLSSGDTNNDNLVDVRDLLTYAVKQGAWLSLDTGSIPNSGAIIAMANRHPDFSGNQAVLGEDLDFIKNAFGTRGNLEAATGNAGGTVLQQLTKAQAIAEGATQAQADTFDINQDGIITKQELLTIVGG